MVENLPAKQETQVGSLGREDPLEKEMATVSHILAWEIPWTEETGGLQQPWGCKRIRHDLATKQQHKVQSLVEVDSLTILDLSGSNQFLL